ncbi:MAG: hypothetical protein AAGJ40_09425 [Planctomycetota bacterium]
MATLTITDRADGTGADFSVAGVVGTATVYVSRYAGDIASNPFSVVITTAVDVTGQAVTLAEGGYSAVVVDGSGPSPPVGFRVTDGTDGLHEQCLKGIREHVIALNLPSFPADDTKHKLHKRPRNTITELTAWAGAGRKNQANIEGVHYWMRPERVRQVHNQRHEIEYRIEFVLVRSRNMSNVVDGDWTHDRERFIESFPLCPLPQIPEVHTVLFFPGIIYSDMDGQTDLDAQSMVVACVAEKSSVTY